jgi:peptidoglycan hydrolase-like protein with peptidoglycan-binding domain
VPDEQDLRNAQELARQLAGKPYIWGGAGPRGCDCSGFMSILINRLQRKRDVYVRLFATGSLAGVAPRIGLRPGLGDANDFSLGVRFPSESRSGIGHVAGTLGGLNVESRGGRGVLAGSAARGANSVLFLHHFHLSVDSVRLGALSVAPPRQLLRPYPGHLHSRTTPDDGHVDLIQERLNQIAGRRGHDVLGHKPLAVDGDFGPDTEKVVKVFQRHRGLDPDGEVGPRTWARMFRR